MAALFELLYEFKEWLRFFYSQTKQKDLIIYSEHQGYYPCFEGLINQFINVHKQSISYITSSRKDPILQEKNPLIRSFYFNKLLPFLMIFMRGKVFLMTLTDLNNFYLKKSIYPLHYVYVFHALVSTNMMYRYGAFDYYDSLLCVGPHQIMELRTDEELRNLPAKKLVEAGYYRLERIYQAYLETNLKNKMDLETKMENRAQRAKGLRKTILIAPSWGQGNVLESYGTRLIELLLNANYKVIVRPHPETVKRFPQLLDDLEKRFSSNSYFSLERSVATDNSLLEADLLISDCSGIMLEYAFGTERPVLSIAVPPKVKNEKFNHLGIEPLELQLRTEFGKVIAPEELENITKVVAELIAQEKRYQKKIQNLRKKWVFNFGNSSSVGAEYVMKILNKDS